MNKREFDRHPLLGVVNDQNISVGARAMYRAVRHKGDEQPPDLLEQRRGLIETVGIRFYADVPLMGFRYMWKGRTNRCSRQDPRYRLRFILDMRLGRRDRYIGDSGFAAWSRGVHGRWSPFGHYYDCIDGVDSVLCYTRSIVRHNRGDGPR